MRSTKVGGAAGPGTTERASLRASLRKGLPLPMGSPRLCAFVAALAALSAPGALAATDFSGETEFPSSGSSKYPDTRNVVPYQPVRPQARPRDFQR